MEDPLSFNLFVLLKLALALALVLLNGMFVAAEFAYVKARPTRIHQLASEGDANAKMAQFGLDHLDAYLSVCQLGITLASLGLGWLGEAAIVSLLLPLFTLLGISSLTLIHTIAVIISFGLITFLHVVFGELAPKSIAIQKAESVALAMAFPMRAFYFLFYPGVVLLNGTANRILNLIKIEPASEAEKTHTQEELQMLISQSYQGGHMGENEQKLLQNVFDFENMVACDVMVSRLDTAFLFKQQSLEQNLLIARESGHTRFPLCDETPDKVIGLIHIKDLLYLEEGSSIDNILRKIMFIPEYLPLDQLLNEFQKEKQQLAVVVDEYGINVGIVTMEDVLEELVGDIQDEFDEEEPDFVQQTDGSFLVAGRMPLDELRELIDLASIEDDHEYNTVAGYVINQFGKIPKEGDCIFADSMTFEVIEMDGLRIDLIKITKKSLSKSNEDNQ
ncbi:MAG: hemolysin family protein [Syntrophomonas sp.]|nr:hemolysin family protein [Syntrophomonas sp.]